MKVLLPTQDLQTITIIPRAEGYEISSDVPSGDAVLSIREDGSGQEELVTDLIIYKVKNFSELTFSSKILKKDRVYSFELKTSEYTLYRGKIYCTDSFDGDKYEMSKEDYKQNSASDNKYTLI
mgnify:FL=1